LRRKVANETRLLIFEAISRNKEMTSSTIVTLRRVAAPTVSHRPKILSHAGLIECRRQGQFVHNRAVPEFVLGQPENAKNKVSELRLPRAAEFFPELVDSKLDRKDKLPSNKTNSTAKVIA
jgi:DNA-binding transcriptional ArsR family regulator